MSETRTKDIEIVRQTLGFFASAIRSGEPWTMTCINASEAAHAALTRLAAVIQPAQDANG